jgi:hypothetical protein
MAADSQVHQDAVDGSEAEITQDGFQGVVARVSKLHSRRDPEKPLLHHGEYGRIPVETDEDPPLSKVTGNGFCMAAHADRRVRNDQSLTESESVDAFFRKNRTVEVTSTLSSITFAAHHFVARGIQGSHP